ncbi:MAG: hypothetical protein HC841_00005, partial [Verrucomicrobiae bacterium]|nr:hypothetical protein [Verrucomicrobiae bacterium]
ADGAVVAPPDSPDADRAPQSPNGFWSTVLDAYGSDWANVPDLTKKMVEADAAIRAPGKDVRERLKAAFDARSATQDAVLGTGKAAFSNMLRAMNAPGAALNLMFDDVADRTSLDGRRLNVTPEDYAKSLAGEGSSADRMEQMNALGEDGTLNRSVGYVRDVVLSPGMLTTAMARIPKVAKPFRG